ncbi:MAG: hypothetical protein ABIO40_11510 [Devosia sp.]
MLNKVVNRVSASYFMHVEQVFGLATVTRWDLTGPEAADVVQRARSEIW